MMRHVFALLAALVFMVCAPSARAAEPTDCDGSDSRITASPDGRFKASVQERVCAVGNRAAAAITVLLVDAKAPEKSASVASIAVPRSREDWPRAVWRDATTLELWIPNLTEMLTLESESQGVRIELHRCNDDPQARERVAAYKQAFEQWKRDTTAWVARRKQDPDGAGARPDRPREPQVPSGRCDTSVGASRAGSG